jgi:hippurate hydrolase
MVRKRLPEIIQGQAASFGVTVEIDYEIGYPATINSPDEAGFAANVAVEIAGEANVEPDGGREMGAEDFAYMLEHRPGAYLFVGNGDTAGVHHPAYDFDDKTATSGASFFARLVERAQPIAS